MRTGRKGHVARNQVIRYYSDTNILFGMDSSVLEHAGCVTISTEFVILTLYERTEVSTNLLISVSTPVQVLASERKMVQMLTSAGLWDLATVPLQLGVG